ncbi:MAG: HD domain-containing protein [Lachnospiraceae bacterium]|nr:HD domain-containing protein [Lachnospiraceae bacterium]
MKSVARMALEAGMILGEDVYSYQNVLVAKENTVVDNPLIAKLARYSIMCVSIKEPADMEVTRYERVRASKSFKNFEAAYEKNLKAYKYMIDDFLKKQTPVNPTFLLQLHDNIRKSIGSGEQLLDMLCYLQPREDTLTYAHCLNSALIGNVFGTWLSLPEDDLKTLTLCGFFYDIGELKLPHRLIWKQDKLNEFEYNWLKTHTTLGYELVKDQDLNTHIKNCTLLHHERCDGSGYPKKRKGEEIDRFSKYIAIVDSYGAMTSDRAFRDSLTPFQVIDNFEKQGFEKYDAIPLQLILKKIAYAQSGKHVRLSDGTEADVSLINEDKLSSPVVKSKETIIDLRQYPSLEISAFL